MNNRRFLTGSSPSWPTVRLHFQASVATSDCDHRNSRSRTVHHRLALMNITASCSRREFITKGGVIVAVASVIGATGSLIGAEKKEEEEVSPAEDLMR